MVIRSFCFALGRNCPRVNFLDQAKRLQLSTAAAPGLVVKILPSLTPTRMSARTRRALSGFSLKHFRHQAPEFVSSVAPKPFFQSSIVSATSRRKAFAEVVFLGFPCGHSKR